MKHLKIVFSIIIMCLCTQAAQAQSVKDILTGVTKAVIGGKATSKSSITGTWKYSGPACEFESESLLAKAGGEAAATKIKNKVAPIMKKAGISDVTYTINSDGTYTSSLKKRTTKGTYKFDEKQKTITFTTSLGRSYTASVVTTGSTMSLLFNADKLMSAVKAISNATSGLSSSASVINSVLGKYSGMKVGFEMKKK